MNQGILFSDLEYCDPDSGAVVFTALADGFQIHCAISLAVMQQRFAATTPEQALALFREHRWDLEEEFEQRIRNQDFNESGWVYLSSPDK